MVSIRSFPVIDAMVEWESEPPNSLRSQPALDHGRL